MTEVSASEPCPELVSVTVCAGLVAPVACEAKLRLEGERVIVGLTVAPVPLMATDCGEPLALSVTESVPVRTPTEVGKNLIEIAQVAPAAMLELQVLV